MLTFDNRRQWTRLVLRMPAKDLSAASKTVLLALEGYADYRDGTGAHPGEQNLAEASGVDVRTVRRALATGRTLGLIQQTAPANPKAHKSAVYSLTLPAHAASSTGHTSPVNNSTTGHTSPVESVDNPVSTGQASPVETRHHRTGMQFLPDTPVLPPKPYTNNPGVLPNWGTSPAQPITEAHTNRPPSRFCDRHPQGTRGVCGDCANARTAFNAWQAAAADHDVAISAAHDIERRRRRQDIDNCPDCDDFGRLDDLTPCHHPKTALAQAVGYA